VEKEMSLSVNAQLELREVVSEMEQLSSLSSLSAQQKIRFSYLQSRASVLKAGGLTSDEVVRAKSAELAKEFGFSTERPTEEQRKLNEQNQEIRSYLRSGREARTGMSVATDTEGGFMVPAGYFRSRVFSMLKAVDRLFDPSVVTMYESENGNVLSVPMLNDTDTSAAIVAENVASVEGEITTVDRLQLAKVPTWRSKKIIWSTELLDDSAFLAEDIIADAIAVRFQRGIGAANVTTLLSAATTGATSASATAVSIDDLLNLMGSIDPSYLASPKCFWLMNFATLISLLKLKDTAGRYQIHPRTDTNGNILILGKPVAICPSMPNVAASSTSIALGAMDSYLRARKP
jgi:HK97 family phage major capsid protein